MSRNRTSALLLAVSLTTAGTAASQTPPATPPADTPSIKVGALLFADYTVQQEPTITDADGNEVTFSAFQIGRAYINITGNLSKTVSFRITPDIVRETGVGSALNGSYSYRLKFAYGQWNLDDHLGAGTFVRFGMQQNPWLDYIDTVYRYRFQGTTFSDREGYLPSADTGVTLEYNLPGEYGDVRTGFFNGETFQRNELNNQKAFQVRGTVRPAPKVEGLKGLRLTGFYDHDAYVEHAERTRAIFGVTYEHAYLNAGFDYHAMTDQTSATRTAIDAQGWSMFVTPKLTHGWEALFRMDHLEPDTSVSGRKKERLIVGGAYWFPHQGNVASALLLDLDRVKYTSFSPTRENERRIAVHALVSF